MNGIFGDLFDLDGNGILDAGEHALEFMMIDELMKTDDGSDDLDGADDLDDPDDDLIF